MDLPGADITDRSSTLETEDGSGRADDEPLSAKGTAFQATLNFLKSSVLPKESSLAQGSPAVFPDSKRSRRLRYFIIASSVAQVAMGLILFAT